jgi:hypothetical protein
MRYLRILVLAAAALVAEYLFHFLDIGNVADRVHPCEHFIFDEEVVVLKAGEIREILFIEPELQIEARNVIGLLKIKGNAVYRNECAISPYQVKCRYLLGSKADVVIIILI